MKKAVLAVFSAIFALLATGCVFVGSDVSSWTDVKTLKNKMFIDSSYAGIQSVRAVQTVLPVRILRSDSDSVSVKCYVERMTVNMSDYKVCARLSGSALEIYQEPEDGVSFRDVSGYLEIRLPDTVQEAVVRSVSGGIRAEGVHLDRLNATTVSGGVGVKTATVNELSVRCVSGGISLGDVKGDALTCETVSGGIRAKSLDFRNVQGKTVSGGITAYLGQDVEDVSFGTVSGGVRLFVKGNLDRNGYDLRTVSGGVRVAGVGEARRHFHLEGRADGAHVQAKATSGGIDVRKW